MGACSRQAAHAVAPSAGTGARVARAVVLGGCLLDADPPALIHVGLLAVLVNVGTFHLGDLLVVMRVAIWGTSPYRLTIISNYKILVKSSCG